jgi:hypothetical protein
LFAYCLILIFRGTVVKGSELDELDGAKSRGKVVSRVHIAELYIALLQRLLQIAGAIPPPKA